MKSTIMNVEGPLVSIIVAVYNVEQYLKRCIDSIVNQNYLNWEVVIIDDGSTDNSGKLCDEYAQKDSRIKVIHQCNKGVSVARQKGLDVVSGKYFIHMDPDDWAEPCMIQCLVNAAESENLDVVYCDFFRNNSYVSVKTEDGHFLNSLIGVKITCVCWNVFIRREIVEKKDIKFEPSFLCYGEDFLFMCRLFSIPNIRIKHLPKAFYHYSTTNKNSLTNVMSDNTLKSMLYVDAQLEKMFEPDKYDGFYTKKKYTIYNVFCSRRFKVMKSLYPELHQRIISERSKHFHWYNMPFQNCVAIALLGYPILGYMALVFGSNMTKISNYFKRQSN